VVGGGLQLPLENPAKGVTGLEKLSRGLEKLPIGFETLAMG
jgi:hypothetical protein